MGGKTWNGNEKIMRYGGKGLKTISTEVVCAEGETKFTFLIVFPLRLNSWYRPNCVWEGAGSNSNTENDKTSPHIEKMIRILSLVR